MWFQKERRVEVCVFRGGRLGYDCGLRRRSLLKRGRARSNGSSVFVQREEGGKAVGAPPRHHSHPSPQHGAGDVGLIKQHEQHKGTRRERSDWAVSTACIIQVQGKTSSLIRFFWSLFFLKAGWKSTDYLKSDATNSALIECVIFMSLIKNYYLSIAINN